MRATRAGRHVSAAALAAGLVVLLLILHHAVMGLMAPLPAMDVSPALASALPGGAIHASAPHDEHGDAGRVSQAPVAAFAVQARDPMLQMPCPLMQARPPARTSHATPHAPRARGAWDGPLCGRARVSGAGDARFGAPRASPSPRPPAVRRALLQVFLL